jgi:serine/threonine protein phosphatase 1
VPGRLIAIGDIHGCLAALQAVLEAVAPRPDDTIVALGDYVDRGPDSRGVIETLRALAGQTQVVSILGNHDEMMLKVCRGRRDLMFDWLAYGGDATLLSYGVLALEAVWPQHLNFLEACPVYFETERHFFVHGNYQPNVALARQPREVLMWESLKKRVPTAHESGKTAVVGHTAQKSGKILDLGYLKCIDTWCYGDGWLTAMDVDTGQVWQAAKNGKRRQ